ncbi:hypothetical protein CHS0354_004203 [Potamilus streckersoni]|uniref:Uncharacterized protein n=1 Tax=Potamilus streckersoni TaxID=2493646 RepID=A0AAE0VHY3_9BIVA|nr:hypothetical protein CHS0354_004203 [Potamilus streckersoni]
MVSTNSFVNEGIHPHMLVDEYSGPILLSFRMVRINSGRSNGNNDSGKCGGDKPSLFTRVTVKFTHNKHKCRHKEDEGNKMQNMNNEEEKIQNGP